MPKIWSQLLTVHAKLGDLFSIPVLFAFLPNKLKETYKKVFVEMKKMVPSLDDEQKFLKTFSCDFERGLMSAARTEFNVKIGKGQLYLTTSQCLKITQYVVFEFYNFGIFHQFLSN